MSAPHPDRRRQPPPWLTVGEVARFLRVSKMTVYRLVDSGLLSGIRVGRSIRVSRDSLNAYLRTSAIAPGDLYGWLARGETPPEDPEV